MQVAKCKLMTAYPGLQWLKSLSVLPKVDLPFSLFNPGLTYKKLDHLEEALDCFLKLHAILRNSDQVMYQLTILYPAHNQTDVWIDVSGFTAFSVRKTLLRDSNLHLCLTLCSHLSVLNIFGQSYEQLGDRQQAIEWLMQVISVTPTDPHALAKLGKLYSDEGDKSQALHYYHEVWKLLFGTVIKHKSPWSWLM